jgi:hypothetical protein
MDHRPNCSCLVRDTFNHHELLVSDFISRLHAEQIVESKYVIKTLVGQDIASCVLSVTVEAKIFGMD